MGAFRGLRWAIFNKIEMSDWTGEYFERGYAQRWGLLPPSDHVRQEAGSLWSLLRLASTARVADIGCGHGRHALVLAELGAEVIGIDFAAALLNRASGLAADLGVHPLWIRGDMRRLPLRGTCVDAALLLDAFGFFDTEEENEAVLHEAARVLMPGGRLGLKIVNGGHVLETFRESDREEREGTVVTVSRTLTFGPPRLTERLSVRGSRGDGGYERRQRLYGAEELRALLERVGFSDVRVFASPDCAPLESTASPTIWIVGQQGDGVGLHRGGELGGLRNSVDSEAALTTWHPKGVRDRRAPIPPAQETSRRMSEGHTERRKPGCDPANETQRNANGRDDSSAPRVAPVVLTTRP
jgi:ubiquinone/menaquinone biosynthesis C-methylase UbiE